MNDGRFIYVFDKDVRDRLIKEGFTLMTNDENNSVFVFLKENNALTFSLDGIEHIISNSLSF